MADTILPDDFARSAHSISWESYRATASSRKARSSFSSAVKSSASQVSPVPTTFWATSFLRLISLSIRSSSVPMHRNLRSWTFLVCPIRDARSFAVALEVFDHTVPLPFRYAAVQEQDLATEGFLQVSP